MKPILLLGLLLAPSLCMAFPATTTLSFVEGEPNLNSLDLTVTATVIIPLSDTDTTQVTGTAEVRFDIDPVTDQILEMTIIGANAFATPLSFNFVLAQLSTMGQLMGTVFTTFPPGLVDPPAGASFDASQHEVLINSGTLEGNAFGTPINVDFASSPVGAVGDGTGAINLTRTGTTATTAEYEVEIELPVDSTTMTMAGTTDVEVRTVGTVKVAGAVSVPLNDYVAWTLENEIPGAPFGGDENGDTVPNGLLWALDLLAGESPWPYLPVMIGSDPPTASIPLPPWGSSTPIFVETSTSLQDPWGLAAGAALSTGVNPIPTGTSGTVTYTFPAGTVGFTRLRVDEP